MAGNNKRKRRKRPATKHYRINTATVIAIVILAYFIARVAMTISKPKISTYEVTAQRINDTISTKALALRSEHVVNIDQAGYVIYYVADKERVGVNSNVYAIDSTGSVNSQLSAEEDSIAISDDDYIDLKNQITDYKNAYKDSEYSTIYDFKYSLDNNIMEIMNDSIIKKINKLTSEGIISDSLLKKKASETGVVSYCYDGMENLTVDNVSPDSFNHTDTSMTQIRSSDIYDANTPVYRLVNSEEWQLVMELTKDQYDKIKKEEFLSVKFLKDDLTVERACEFFERGGGYFVSLSFNKYMERYMDDRYLDVEIIIDSVKGLKIPNSSVLTEELYSIPMKYSTMADEAVSGVTFNKIVKDDNGYYETVAFAPTICYVDNKHDLYYVSSVDVSAGDQIIYTPSDTKDKDDEEDNKIKNGDGEIYTISKKKEFKGVFLINKGFTQFIVINSLYEADDFCIAEDNNLYGISQYDHIILNHSSIGEGQNIY
ncbi:MAG: hypothetical protein K5656_03560 [Lachnospiraceae bacterium]|nr:hypothetical protein [Lachnospiraceae bacterium]